MSDETIRSLSIKILKLQNAYDKLEKKMAQAHSMDVEYNDADPNNADEPRWLRGVLCSRVIGKDSIASISIFTDRSGSIWQKFDVPLGVKPGCWRPLFLAQTFDEVVEKLAEEPEDEGAEVNAGKGSRRPAAITRP